MLKKVLFVVFLAVVFSAIALSASQLAAAPVVRAACGSPCVSSLGCARPCFCFIPPGGGTGNCQPDGPPTGGLKLSNPGR